jgi:hypothetical protein
MTIADRYNQRILAAFETALDQIDALEREPSRREQDLLANALAYMICGQYRFARAELRELARSRRSPEGLGEPAASRRQPYTMAMLRRGHLRLGAFV